jgi:hypothetical protein
MVKLYDAMICEGYYTSKHKPDFLLYLLTCEKIASCLNIQAVE